jgi:hypothetical protein
VDPIGPHPPRIELLLFAKNSITDSVLHFSDITSKFRTVAIFRNFRLANSVSYIMCGYLQAAFHISGPGASPVTAVGARGKESVSHGLHAVTVRNANCRSSFQDPRSTGSMFLPPQKFVSPLWCCVSLVWHNFHADDHIRLLFPLYRFMPRG